MPVKVPDGHAVCSINQITGMLDIYQLNISHTAHNNYKGIFFKAEMYLFFLSTQVLYCLQNIKPTDRDIMLTIKPCWPVRSQKLLERFKPALIWLRCTKLPHRRWPTIKKQLLKMFTLETVYQYVGYQWPKTLFVGERPKPREKVM